MAQLWNKQMHSTNETDVDDFFGDLNDTNNETFAAVHSVDQHQRDSHNDKHDKDDVEGKNLADAEELAVASRFRKLGFHQSYEQAKEQAWSRGVEQGYRDNYEAAVCVGELLGAESIVCVLNQRAGSKVSSNDDFSSTSDGDGLATDDSLSQHEQYNNSNSNSNSNSDKFTSTSDTGKVDDKRYLDVAKMVREYLVQGNDGMSERQSLDELEQSIRQMLAD
jgi:hypothetical protein